jgi:hypothetical protein
VTTFVERIAQAWADASDFASAAAEGLNAAVRDQGTRSPWAKAQGDWIAECERYDRMHDLVASVAGGDDYVEYVPPKARAA